MSTSSCARATVYKRRYRAGLRTFRLAADPVDVAEFLTEAGILVAANSDSQALGDCLTELVQRWHDGRLGLLVRGPDAEDDAGAA
jgi:hypothetical protein